MTRREQLAIAYAEARLEVLRLKRERKACHCEHAAESDMTIGDSGESPCWVKYRNESDESRRLSAEEMCRPCQRRQVFHDTLKQALRAEASALGKLRRVAP